MFWVLKRTVSEIKDEKTLLSFAFIWCKVLPTADQINLTMFDDLYIKHNLSNSGEENSLEY